jgi:hypothetical protein
LGGRNVKDTYTPKSNLFANKMNVELDVLRPAMMNWIGGEVDSRNVVAVHNSGLVDRTGELKKELTKPRALSDGVGHGAILSLGTGTRDCRLPLGRPGDKRWSKINTVPRGGAPGIRAARPVCIGISDDVRGWRSV